MCNLCNMCNLKSWIIFVYCVQDWTGMECHQRKRIHVLHCCHLSAQRTFLESGTQIAIIWLERNISRCMIGILPYPSYMIISDVLPLSKSFLALNENLMAPIPATQLRNTLSIEHTSQSFVLSPPSFTEIKHMWKSVLYWVSSTHSYWRELIWYLSRNKFFFYIKNSLR